MTTYSDLLSVIFPILQDLHKSSFGPLSQCQVLTRRDQLKLRAAKKSKGPEEGGEAEGGEENATGKKRKGKGSGKGKGKGKGKKRKAVEEGEEVKPSRRGRNRTVAEAPPARASKKRKSQPTQTPVFVSGGSTEKAPKKSKKPADSEANKATPKPKTTRKRSVDQAESDKNPSKKTRRTKSSKSSDMPKPPLPAQPGPDQHEADQLDEVHLPEPSTRGNGTGKSKRAKPTKTTKGRKVATPQNHDPPAAPSYEIQVYEELIPMFKGELAHQWKSGKTNLKLEDFEPAVFERATMSNYFSRSRPAIGLKLRKNVDLGSVHRTSPFNNEWAYFSFGLKDVCNVGLAWKCATHTVLSIMNQCLFFSIICPQRMI